MIEIMMLNSAFQWALLRACKVIGILREVDGKRKDSRRREGRGDCD